MDSEETGHDEHAQFHAGGDEAGVSDEETETAPAQPRELPADLPRSLDDRRTAPTYGEETEYYDAWQGRGFVYMYTTSNLLTPCRSVAVHHGSNL